MWDRISLSYSSPRRHYHTLLHLHRMFVWLDKIENIADRTAIELAIWFHDYVYETSQEKYSYNEQNSSIAMMTLCSQYSKRLYNDINVIRIASHLILCTKSHTVIDTVNEQLWKTTAYFLDIDLSILGETPDVVNVFETDIRSEFNQYSDSEFITGRLVALNEFKKRDSIFFTDFFKHHLEKSAQSNLNRVIQDLTNHQNTT